MAANSRVSALGAYGNSAVVTVALVSARTASLATLMPATIRTRRPFGRTNPRSPGTRASKRLRGVAAPGVGLRVTSALSISSPRQRTRREKGEGPAPRRSRRRAPRLVARRLRRGGLGSQTDVITVADRSRPPRRSTSASRISVLDRGQRGYDHVCRRRTRMPLFMDRHDVPGVTAEQVAQAHLADLDMGAKFGVQFLAYWFDADQGEAFCLAKAPTSASLTAVHKATHGLIPNEIISVSENNVLRLLSRISETGGDTVGLNPFRTILFTDLEGSTSILEAVEQAAFMVLLTEHDLIIRRALVAAHGREVKHTGDGLMASFDDVASALGCSMTIQAGFEARTADAPNTDLRVRIGIAAGEPVDRNDDLFGSTVTLASRICGAAEAGRILTSDMVRDLGSERGYTFDGGRDVVLKGFARP